LLLASLVGRQQAVRGSAFKDLVKAKTVTAAERERGAAGAVFDVTANLGLVSDERAASGGVMAGVKKAKTDNLTLFARINLI
jgi:hypothetical protein